MKITKRDVHLLQTLDAYSLLSTPQVNALNFPGIDFRTMLRRLRKLERAKLLQRTKDYRGGVSVWYLTGTGARRIGREPCIRTLNKNVLEHDLRVNDLRINLAPLRMVNSWKSAHQIKHERGVEVHPLSSMLDTIPDWLCRINSWNGQRNVAMEVELSYKGPSRMENVFYAYLRKSRLHHVWYFVATETMGETFTHIVRRITKPMDKFDPLWFLWSNISEITDPSQIRLRTLTGEMALGDLFAIPAHRSTHPVGTLKAPSQIHSRANTSQLHTVLGPGSTEPYRQYL